MKVIHDIVIMTLSMAEYVSVCTQMSVCMSVQAGSRWERWCWGERVTIRMVCFSVRPVRPAAQQPVNANTKLRDWNTFHPWPPTGQQWQACSSITKHHCSLSLSVTHTNTHTCAHACVPVEGCMFAVWLHVFYVCICVYGCFLWTFHTITCLFVC